MARCRGGVLFAILTAASLLIVAQAAKITDIYPASGSLAGGTYVTLKGSGFNFLGGDFGATESQSITIGDVPCKIVSHFTSSTEVVCITGAWPKSSDSGRVYVQMITNIGGNIDYVKGPSYHYQSGQRVRLLWSDSWAATGGDIVTFAGWLKRDTSADQLEVNIGALTCTTSEELRPVKYERGMHQVQCELPQDILALPGHFNMTIRQKALDPAAEGSECENSVCLQSNGKQSREGGYGYGIISMSGGELKTIGSGFADLATGTPYMFTLYPEIASIWPMSGGVHGGQRLTIRGSSFSTAMDDNQVFVGNIPCELVEAKTDQLTCVLGAWSSQGSTGPFRTLRGLEDILYDIGLPSPADAEPWNVTVLKDQIDWVNQTDLYSMSTRYGEGLPNKYRHVIHGFFVPPLSASYQFYITGERNVTVFLGTSSDEASLQQVAKAVDHNYIDSRQRPYHPAVFYDMYRENLTELQGPDEMISRPQLLEAGKPYAFKLVHESPTNHRWDTGHWTRLSLRVSGLQGAKRADGSALSADSAATLARALTAAPLQVLRMKQLPSRRYEEHIIPIRSFQDAGQITLQAVTEDGLEISKQFRKGDFTAYNIRRWLTDTTVNRLGEAKVRFNKCYRSTHVELGDITESTDLRVELRCDLPVGQAKWFDLKVQQASGLLAGPLQYMRGSAGVGGSYRLCYGDDLCTRDLDVWSDKGSRLLSKIEQDLRREPPAALELETFWEDTSSLDWFVFIHFAQPIANVKLLKVDSTNLLGEGIALEVVQLDEGDTNAMMMHRVPADMFGVPLPKDVGSLPVRVVSRGVLAGSRDIHAPSFKYEASKTPQLVSASPSAVTLGTKMTIVARGVQAGNWSEDIEVHIGMAKCSLTQGSESPDGSHQFSCTVGQGSAGDHKVVLYSKSAGVANPVAAPSVKYTPGQATMEPSSGSLAGGTVVAFSGSGFLGISCQDILIGGSPCSAPEGIGNASHNMPAGDVMCMTPKSKGFDATSDPSAAADVLAEASVAGVAVGSFSYAASRTPWLSAVGPTSVSPAASNTLTLTGSGLATPDGPTMVRFESQLCDVGASSSSSLTCLLPRAAPTPPAGTSLKPTVYVPRRGFASVGSSVSLNYAFRVTSISPKVGSIAGGTELTLTGSFVEPVDGLTVSIQMTDGSKHSCFVTGGDASQVKCVVQGATATPAARRLAAAAHEEVAKHDCDSHETPDASIGHCLSHRVQQFGSLRTASGAQDHPVARRLREGAPARSLRGRHSVHLAGHGQFTEEARRLQSASTIGNVTVSKNGVTATCGNACDFSFEDGSTPTVLEVSPLTNNGTGAQRVKVTIKISGDVTGLNPRVRFGDYECLVESSGVQSGLTVVVVDLCDWPASAQPIFVQFEPTGYAAKASPFSGTDFMFERVLEATTFSPSAGSQFGGQLLTIAGSGFSVASDPQVLKQGHVSEYQPGPSGARQWAFQAHRVLIGGKLCNIASVTGTEIKCHTPPSSASSKVEVQMLSVPRYEDWVQDENVLDCYGSDIVRTPAYYDKIDPATLDEGLGPNAGFTLSGYGKIKLKKAACPVIQGETISMWTIMPAGATRAGVTFKITTSDSWIIPFQVTMYHSSDPEKRFVWCFRQSGLEGCDKNDRYFPVNEWRLKHFEVEEFVQKFPDLRPNRLSIGLASRENLATTFVNEVMFEETVEFANEYSYLDWDNSPRLTTSTVSGERLTLAGDRLGAEAGKAALGNHIVPEENFLCGDVTWGQEITCTVPKLPAGSWRVRVWTTELGWSSAGNDVQVTAAITSVEHVGGFHVGEVGQAELILHGRGFGMEPEQMEVEVCGLPANVTIVVGTTKASLYTPARFPPSLVDAHPEFFPPGDLVGSAGRFFTDYDRESEEVAKAPFTTGIDSGFCIYRNAAEDCWFAYELRQNIEARLTSVEFFPPTDTGRREGVRNATFEASYNGQNWTRVAAFADVIEEGETTLKYLGWNKFDVTDSGPYRFFRAKFPQSACRNRYTLLRAIRFSGVLLDTAPLASCPIVLKNVVSPLAFMYLGGENQATETLSHVSSKTPVVTSISPRRGGARGGTTITVEGSNLLSGTDARIELNGYECQVTASTATSITCLTTERSDGIKPPSTRVWTPQGGVAVIAGSKDDTTFLYIDNWSDVYSWKDSEPPVAGDSVIVPEGQAILLDKSTPVLFFVLVSGHMEFDRKDIEFSAFYLWVAGGHLIIGTETKPFMQQATITMYGDRIKNIELPFIGSKMVAVSNLGGLHGGCHVAALRVEGNAHEPCPVRSVGKLDIHGRPDVAWTRLDETAPVGATFLRLADPVRWRVGDMFVVSPTERGTAEEERLVSRLSEDGKTVFFDEPLKFEHHGAWWSHPAASSPTDLRAAVGLLTKTVRIQGDESSGDPLAGDLGFGAHIGAFFGGELRIENTEFTRTGQAANFGRYSSHFHKMSPGRTIDMLDKAYLRNNTYRDTFQRAIVVHSSDHAVIRNNVALRTKGHSFLTEVGDEHWADFTHNLAINPRPHPILLDDDSAPAGFWIPGFVGWHRDNLVAGASKGWRLKSLGGVAGQQATLIFSGNSAHACGFGWHLFPPHAPPKQLTFTDFTVFRSGTGMFYYSTARIEHVDHRFVEVGTAHTSQHFSGAITDPPFYRDLMVVGSIQENPTKSRTRMGVFGPRDSDTWFLSGVKFINLLNTTSLIGGEGNVATMRSERMEWHNSGRRAGSISSDHWGIFWDLDGTLTGVRNGFIAQDKEYLRHEGICSPSVDSPGGVMCGLQSGSLRVRRLALTKPEPHQLDGKLMKVTSEVGSDHHVFIPLKLYGWGIPVVAGKEYTLEPAVKNSIQKMDVAYGTSGQVFQAHGLTTMVQPMDEGVYVHYPYNEWRNHFECDPGQRVDREPVQSDPFGTCAVKLDKEDCAQITTLSELAKTKCSGEYVNETGWLLKTLLELDTTNPEPDGMLSTSLYTTVESKKNKHSIQARECPVGGCPKPGRGLKPETSARRMWSDASRWPGGQLPKAGEHVNISAGDRVVVDVETPELYWVTVIGMLEFLPGKLGTLHCRGMKVWGWLEMGTAENPIPWGSKAEVVIHGSASDHTMVVAESLFLNAKTIAIMGNATAFGTPRAAKSWTKLAATADIGARTITVVGDVSKWPKGASIGIGSTEFPSPPRDTDTEVMEVSSAAYDATSGRTTVTLGKALTKRHFAGAIDTQGANHSIKLAAVVTLLGGSNVGFRSSDASPFGGSIAIVGAPSKEWGDYLGQVEFNNVDFVQMGKFEEQLPAMLFRFVGGLRGKAPKSIVQQCVFSHSHSGAMELFGVNEIDVIGNVFHRTYRTALWLTSDSIWGKANIVGNLALETLRHPEESTVFYRPFAAFLIEVTMARFEGNVAAGSTGSGFVMRPNEETCAPNGQGVALSEETANEAVGCVVGFFVLTCKGACRKCISLSGVVAWKNAHAGILTADQTNNMMVEAVVLSDNHIGMTLNFFTKGDDTQHRVFAHNFYVFGSSPASTCSASTDCKAMFASSKDSSKCGSVVGSKFRRVGLLSHTVNALPKMCEKNGKLSVCRPPNTPVKDCMAPFDQREGTQGSRYSEAHYSNVTFGHFVRDDCNERSIAFMSSPAAPHTGLPNFFKGVKWMTSVEESAKIDLSPDGMPAVADGRTQAVIHDVDGSMLGSGVPGGTILSIDAYNTIATADCQLKVGHVACPNLPLRYLTWDGLGMPFNRVLGDMTATRASDNRSSTSRGAYKSICVPQPPRSNERAWQVKPNEAYDLTLFASPPKSLRLRFFSASTAESVLLSIFLSQPFALTPFLDGRRLRDEYNTAKDPKAPRYPTFEDKHGSYAFDPQARRIFITLRGDRRNMDGRNRLDYLMSQVVQLSLTVSVPITEFDGPAFVQNVAMLLEISPDRIKVVSVQSAAEVAAQGGRRLQKDGAVVVIQIREDEPEGGNESALLDDPEFDNASTSELQSLASKMQSAAEDGSLSSAVGVEVELKEIETSDVSKPSTATEAPDVEVVSKNPGATKEGFSVIDIFAMLGGLILGGFSGVALVGVLTKVALKYKFPKKRFEEDFGPSATATE